MSSRRRPVDPAGRMVSVQVSVPVAVRDQLRDLGEPLGLSLSSVGRFVLLAGLASARLELDEVVDGVVEVVEGSVEVIVEGVVDAS
jgi:hypothetical protein